MANATITGPLVRPDNPAVGVQADVLAIPQTVSAAVPLPGSAGYALGPCRARSDETGAFSLTVPIVAGVLWKIYARPLFSDAYALAEWTVGFFEITATTTLKALVPTPQQTLATPTQVAAIFDALAQVEAGKDAAAGFASQAQAAVPAATAAGAQQVALAKAEADRARDVANIEVAADVVQAVDADPESGFRQQQDARLTATFVAPVIIAKAATGVAATDTANAQAAINACPEGGWVHFPGGVLGNVPYRLNAALTVNKHLKITGANVGVNTASNKLPDNPGGAPWAFGTVFEQTAPAMDAIQLTGASKRVDISDIAVVFADAIKFTNTGHGINATGPLVDGHAYHAPGVTSATWRNIVVYGHDGNHYAYKITNPMHNTLETLRSHGGGIMHVLADNPLVNWGNTVVIHPFGSLFAGGTADGYRLETTTVAGGADGGGLGLLNFMVFIRPQCNISGNIAGATNPTASQLIWRDAEATLNRFRNNTVIAPDLEPNLAGVVSTVTFLPGTAVMAGGGVLPTNTWYREKKRHSSSPTVAIGNAGLDYGTATLNGNPPSTDLAGSVICSTGANPALNVIFTVTFETPMTEPPVFIRVFELSPVPSGRTFGVSYVLVGGKVTGFVVRASSILPASTAGQQFGYWVHQ